MLFQKLGNRYRIRSVLLSTRINWKAKDESTGLPSLSKSAINNTRLLTPKIAVNKSRIGALFAKLDSLIALHQRELEILKNLKKALLEKMFV